MGNVDSAAQQYVEALVDGTNSLADSVGKLTGFSAEKIYHVKFEGKAFVIVLRHELSGARKLYVNRTCGCPLL